LFIYQWVAAASLILAVGFVAGSYLFGGMTINKDVANNNNPNKDVNTAIIENGGDESAADSQPADEGATPANDTEGPQKPENTSSTDTQSAAFIAANDVEDDEKVINVPGQKNNAIAERPLVEQPKVLSSIQSIEKQELVITSNIEKPKYRNIYRIPTIEDLGLIAKEEPQKFWAGINVASGVFSPEFSSNSGVGASSADYSYARDAASVIPANRSLNNALNESADYSTASVDGNSVPGFSYSAGINAGFRLNRRLSVETGLMYLKNSNTSNTNVVIANKSNDNTYPLTVANYGEQAYNLSRVSNTNQDIALNNTYEYVSIPVKAAFDVVNSNFGVALTAGLATDLFIQNSVSAQDGGLSEYTLKSGDSSPFRNMYFNGTIGTRLTYNIPGQKYSFMVEPSYLIALNDMTKNEYFFNSRPRAWRVGVGIRYHFN
jgi:hypothetical protein